MNLTSLWAGNDYAYYDMRGRGEQFRPNAKRVRVVRVFKRREMYNERESGFATVLFVADDGTLDPLTREREVRARDIAMRWEEYSDERDHREANRARLNAEAEQRAAAEIDKKERILNALETKGVPRTWISSIDEYGIRLNRHIVERELEVNGG